MKQSGKKGRFLLAWFMLLGLIPSGSVEAREIVVSAAASLSGAFGEIAAQFEKEQPGVRVVGNYAASGTLYRQIELGAPVDVYASANQRWMAAAVAKQLVSSEQVKNFAGNSLVLAVPAANPGRVGSLEDLQQPRVKKIAVGSPDTVPAGSYARASLQRLKVWDNLSDKLIYAENVTQVLNYLRHREVEAGFIYGSDVVRGQEGVRVIARLPLTEAISYPIAPLAASREPELTARFIELVLSPRGQAILTRYGFLPTD